MYEKDKGLKTVSVEDYYENKDNYQALTNSQVLGLREQDNNLAFNGDILKDISASLGMKSVVTELTDIVNKFGAMTRSEYIQSYLRSLYYWDVALTPAHANGLEIDLHDLGYDISQDIHVYSMNKPDVAAAIQANLSDILGKF